jgi:hypothetical protein
MGCDFYSKESLYIEYNDNTFDFIDLDCERHYTDWVNESELDDAIENYLLQHPYEKIFENSQWKNATYKTILINMDMSKVKLIEKDIYTWKR